MKKTRLWLKVSAWCFIVTATLHSLSLINKPVGENETENQLIDLMTTYQLTGVNRTFYELFTFFSLNLTFSTLFSAAVLFLVLGFNPAARQLKKLTYFYFGAWTLFMIPLILLTFIVPIACYAICWLFLLVAAISAYRSREEAQA